MGNSSPYHHPKGSRRRDSWRFLKATGSSLSHTPVLKKVVALPEEWQAVPAKLFFRNSSLKQLQIPSSVDRIRFSAFEGCGNLVCVDLKNGLTTIEIQAFCHCSALQHIRIPSTVATIGTAAFSHCTSLVVVDLPKDGGCRKIGSLAFSNCTSLVTIAIPSSVQLLGSRAMEHCTSLVEAYLPNGLLRVEEGLFACCISLERIAIPSSVKLIRREALVGCVSLVQVDLPEGLQTIEALAFWKCHALKQIDLVRTKTIEFLAFSACNRLKEISLPLGLNCVEKECFRDCTLLEKVQVPSSVIHIREGAFFGCVSLVKVCLEQGLQSLGGAAFSTCLSLAAIYIPSTVDSIAYQAFFNCQSLTTVEISSHCAEVDIHDGAFMHCQSLVNICIPKATSNQVDVESWKFIGCPFLLQQCDGWMLGHVLSTRLDDYPVHRLCYHASETTLEELQTLNSGQDDHLVDVFGMTPFHILLASATARLDILQSLLERYPPQVLNWKDNYGKRAEEYLSNVWMDGSQCMMKLVMQARFLDRLSNWGFEPWRLQMEHKIHRLIEAKDKASRNKHLRGVNVLMKRYSQIEIVTLLELWLWKQKMISEENATATGDRENCRARCGFSFIRPMVFGFLRTETEA